MQQVIEAAWIAAGVGGLGVVSTAVIGYLGFRNTRKTTERTVAAGAASTRATLAAAREERLWEKRAAAYEETLTDLRHRQTKRRHDLRGYRWDETSEQKLNDFFANYEPPDWFQAQARMVAYASNPVLDAFEASHRAHLGVRDRYQRWKAMGDDNKRAAETGRPGAAHDGGETLKAHKEINPVLEEAEVRDEALIKLIRDELRSVPEAA
jgi:hypothetical protein